MITKKINWGDFLLVIKVKIWGAFLRFFNGKFEVSILETKSQHIWGGVILELKYTEFQCSTMPGTGLKVCGGMERCGGVNQF